VTAAPEAVEFAARSKGISGGTPYYEFAIRDLALEKAGALLDLGCGSGAFAGFLTANFKAAVDGVDLVAYPGFDPKTHYRAFTIWDLNELENAPVRDRYDFVFALGLVEYLENPRKFVRGAARFVRPGGKFVLLAPNPASLRSIVSLLVEGRFSQFKPPQSPSSISPILPRDMARIFDESGFAQTQLDFSNSGQWPLRTPHKYQSLFPFLKGRLFSDNFRVIGTRQSEGRSPAL
jgi:SAM-dependent methyltransferase